jgi:hypothetical protein
MIFDLWLFQRHLSAALKRPVPEYMERAVAELLSIVEAKRGLNAQMTRARLAAVALNPFKLIEDADWTDRVEKLRAMCQRSNTHFTPPEPPVDYLSDEERDEGTRYALAFCEGLEFAALKQKYSTVGGSFVPSDWVAPAPRLSDRLDLTQQPKAAQMAQACAPLFDETALRRLAHVSVAEEFQRWRLCPAPTHGDAVHDAAVARACSEADIVLYVRLMAPTFPLLARVWRALLAMPITTAHLESSFSVTKIVDDERRTRLTSRMLECLAISRLWKDVFPVYLAGVLEEWRSVPGWKPPAPSRWMWRRGMRGRTLLRRSPCCP